ncbi:dystrotelin isoform X3 [Pelmatolapia mariae]|uniref:dystrotelin isoform X3 n=1 Tax=Pelmatolapia mariae TaxID=158779 RepID=UPI002FE5818D
MYMNLSIDTETMKFTQMFMFTSVSRCLCSPVFPDVYVHQCLQMFASCLSESFNQICPSGYRTAMKLQALQRLCCLDTVLVRHVTAALHSGGGAQRDVAMSRQEVTCALNRMFHSASQEVPVHVTAAATEETCSLMFRLFDRSQSDEVSGRSLQTALIALSSDNLLLKYRGLLQVSTTPSGSISKPGLRCLLMDLIQVPAAVQEEVVFDDLEAAVQSCFKGVLTPTVSKHHLLSWLQSEPCLLLWLSTLYRLSASQSVQHNVRCHICKTRPFTGLRYRCMKCVNVHVCQSCFLTDRQTRKHKTHHPMLVFCKQPTWRESLTSLVRSAHHTLLPRRHTQREANWKRVLMWEEPSETENKGPPTSDASTRLVGSAHSSSSERGVSHGASEAPPPRCSSSCKSLQTNEDTSSQQAVALLTDVKNLQRDRWLLEQELQTFRLTVQSEQGILEERCSEMEVTVETLTRYNAQLQGMLTQALNKMEAQQHGSNMPNSANTENTERGTITPTSDTLKSTEEETEEEEEIEDEWSQEELQTQTSPTIHQGSPPSPDGDCEEESAGRMSPHHPVELQHGPEEAELQGERNSLSEEEEEHGPRSSETLLQGTVERLKAALETHRWTHTGERTRAELLQAAEQVGDSMLHLVDAMETNSPADSSSLENFI